MDEFHQDGDYTGPYQNWFEQGSPVNNYTLECYQARVDNMFQDQETLEQTYRNMRSIAFNKNSYTFQYSPYYDIYIANLKPYLPVTPGNFRYTIQFGGKTLLKSEQVYNWSTPPEGSPGIDHLTGSLPAGYMLLSDVEYHYDNPLHVNPTRIEKKLPNGDKNTLVTHRVLDFREADTEYPYSAIKESNVLSLVLKQQNWYQEAGDSQHVLIDENITEILERCRLGSPSTILPIATYSRISPEQNKLQTIPLQSTHVVTSSGYRCDKEMTYVSQHRDFSNLPESGETPAGKEWYYYCTRNQELILKIDDHAPSLVDVTDQKSIEGMSSNLLKFLRDTLPVFSDLNRFLDSYYSLSPEQFTQLRQTINNDEHIKEFLHICRYLTGRDLILNSYYADYPDTVEALFNEILNQVKTYPIFTHEINFSEFKNVLSNYRIRRNSLVYRYLPLALAEIPPLFEKNDRLSITPGELKESFIVTLVMKPTTSTVSIPVVTRTATSTITRNSDPVTVKAGVWQLVRFPLSVDGTQDIKELSVTLPASACYGLMAPALARFESTCYDANGWVFCDFNQQGMINFYTHDDRGRVTRVLDGEGNVLREHEYKDY